MSLMEIITLSEQPFSLRPRPPVILSEAQRSRTDLHTNQTRSSSPVKHLDRAHLVPPVRQSLLGPVPTFAMLLDFPIVAVAVSGISACASTAVSGFEFDRDFLRTARRPSKHLDGFRSVTFLLDPNICHGIAVANEKDPH